MRQELPIGYGEPNLVLTQVPRAALSSPRGFRTQQTQHIVGHKATRADDACHWPNLFDATSSSVGVSGSCESRCRLVYGRLQGMALTRRGGKGKALIASRPACFPFSQGLRVGLGWAGLG
ncbi:hypothetical protein E2C01_016354 [Portunus trituberculatus]|uniref:Uncharacterized protein n=1 Tax=Portunus trituberculatus TaxID=210409 RepID=A0A5B7DP64_PORTR|nr:hypothetical protein [Portunus trituberculatus]